MRRERKETKQNQNAREKTCIKEEMRDDTNFVIPNVRSESQKWRVLIHKLLQRVKGADRHKNKAAEEIQ